MSFAFVITLGQTLMVQVAKRGASVLKRRKSRNRMEPPSAMSSANTSGGTATASTSSTVLVNPNSDAACGESDGDVVFYVEEPRAGE